MLGGQRRNPVQPGWLQVFADARRCQQATIPTQSDALYIEAFPNLVHLRRQGGRVCGVAGKHFHRHRTAIGSAQQAKHDLLLAFLAVPVVAVQIAGADIIQKQRAALEVAVSQALFNPPLALGQPLQHGEHLIAGHGTEMQQLAEAGRGGLGGQSTGRAQFGFRVQQASDDAGQHQTALATGGVMLETFEPQPLAHAQCRHHMLVGSKNAVVVRKWFGHPHTQQPCTEYINQFTEE